MKNNKHVNRTLQHLTTIDLLKGCTDQQLQALVSNSDIARASPGTVVERRGTRPRQFLGIVEGCVEAIDASGHRTLLGAGDQIGAAELLADLDLRSTYTAITPVTFVAVFGPTFRAATRDMPSRVVFKALYAALDQPSFDLTPAL